MKAESHETQTTSDEKNEKSAWARFCHRRGINHNLLMLKMTLFVMHGGKRSDSVTMIRQQLLPYDAMKDIYEINI